MSLLEAIQQAFQKKKDPFLDTDVMGDIPFSNADQVSDVPSSPSLKFSGFLGKLIPQKTSLKHPKKEHGGKHPAGKIHKTRLLVLALTGIIGMTAGYLYMNWQDDQEAAQRAARNAKPKVSTNVFSDNESYPDSMNANPFIEATGAQMASADGKIVPPITGSTTVRATPSTGGGARYSYRDLPAIPYATPRPDLPSFSVPSRPAVLPAGNSVPASAPAHTPAMASVSGVMTGSNGDNIAVMSDGSVVTEGETYQDKRIAFIGGDGIQFDDGSSIQYQP